MDNGMLGKYVIVRCRDAGVHAGVLIAHEGREAVLTESRRLWYWKPAKNKKFLSGVAVAGAAAATATATAEAGAMTTEPCARSSKRWRRSER